MKHDSPVTRGDINKRRRGISIAAEKFNLLNLRYFRVYLQLAYLQCTPMFSKYGPLFLFLLPPKSEYNIMKNATNPKSKASNKKECPKQV
jgi:hypothetical protein